MTRRRIVCRTLKLTAMCIVSLLAGCSGSDSPSGPGSTNPAGTGSTTLLVVGGVSGSDVGGGLFITDFSVTASDTAALPVSGATVSVQGPFGTIALSEEPLNPGTYTASRADYLPGSYTLSVVRGTDRVSGVRVSAPDIHTITSHAPFDTVTANQSVMVQWTRVSPADEMRLETRDFVSSGQDPDTGSMSVPPSGNPPRTDQRIRVWRTRRQAAAGGLPGSEFVGTVRNSVEPIIAQ